MALPPTPNPLDHAYNIVCMIGVLEVIAVPHVHASQQVLKLHSQRIENKQRYFKVPSKITRMLNILYNEPARENAQLACKSIKK